MVNKITVQIEDKTYVDFKSFSLYKDIEALSGTFSVSVSPPADMANFIVDIRDPNSSIIIAIDDEPIITGYLDGIDISYDVQSHEIILEGRDKTADFIDSTLESKTFNPPIGFVALLTKLLQIVGYEVVSSQKLIGFGQLGKKQISIINNVGDIQPFDTSEGIQLRHSESAYDLIKKMAEKRQLILRANGNGNIIIEKVGMLHAKTILQNIDQESASNNIKKGNVKINFKERFNQYTIKSMLNKANNGAPFGDDSSDISNIGVAQSGATFDDQVRATRKYTAIGSSSMNSTDCKKRATWQANIARTKGFYYCCEVFGFRQNLNEVSAESSGGLVQLFGSPSNPLWFPNQLVYVNDEFANIDDDMLIKSVLFTQDLERGSITRMELVDKNSYSLSLFEPLLRKRIDKEVTQKLFGE
jgi:prophage tail gpP-like protein